VKYAFIQAHCNEYKLKGLCDVLEVSSSGYHDWRDRPESNRSLENKRLTTKIAYYHQQSREIYGSPKIHEDLIRGGEPINFMHFHKVLLSSPVSKSGILLPKF